jgi:pyroglutamyl-peptidase
MGPLVIGFEAWGGLPENPSGVLASNRGGLVLPVSWKGAYPRLHRTLREQRPSALLMLGLAESRNSVSLEVQAHNLDYCEQRGWKRPPRPIERGSPDLLPGRWPATRWVKLLRRRGIPVTLSFHAGTFLCNHVYYRALREFDGPCGFVHLPPFKAVSKSLQEQAVEILVRGLERVATTAR